TNQVSAPGTISNRRCCAWSDSGVPRKSAIIKGSLVRSTNGAPMPSDKKNDADDVAEPESSDEPDASGDDEDDELEVEIDVVAVDDDEDEDDDDDEDDEQESAEPKAAPVVVAPVVAAPIRPQPGRARPPRPRSRHRGGRRVHLSEGRRDGGTGGRAQTADDGTSHGAAGAHRAPRGERHRQQRLSGSRGCPRGAEAGVEDGGRHRSAGEARPTDGHAPAGRAEGGGEARGGGGGQTRIRRCREDADGDTHREATGQ